MGLLNVVFAKQLQAYKQQLKIEQEHQIALARSECMILERQYELVRRIFSIMSGAQIIGFEKNKRGQELLVTKVVTQQSLNIYLYGESYQGIIGLPRLMATYHLIPSGDINSISYSIRIEDIQEEGNKIGNGTIAMKYFLKTVDELRKAYGMNITYIDGELSPVDKDHFDRSEAFYKKFGFEVKFSEGRTSGSIYKALG